MRSSKKYTFLTSLFFLIAIPFLSFSTNPTPIETQILFVTYDTGETNAFKPVFEALDHQDIPYKIIALGTSATLLKDHPHLLNCPLPMLPSPLEREKGLRSETLNSLTHCVHPKKVIVSMAAESMADIASAFHETGAKVFAYYDNFDDIRTKDYVKPFLHSHPSVDVYFVPSSLTKKSLEAYFGPAFLPSHIIIVGQPSLESWRQVYKETNPATLKETTQLTTDLPILLFAGGYDPTYPEFFRLFVQGVMESNTFGIVTLHPKSDGTTERQIIEEEQAQDKVRLFGKEGPKTDQLSTLARVVLCHKSTVCMQALTMGKPVIYLANKKDYTNQAIEEGVALEAENLPEFLKAIDQSLSGKTSPSLEKLGIPQESIQTFVKEILS